MTELVYGGKPLYLVPEIYPGRCTGCDFELDWGSQDCAHRDAIKCVANHTIAVRDLSAHIASKLTGELP